MHPSCAIMCCQDAAPAPSPSTPLLSLPSPLNVFIPTALPSLCFQFITYRASSPRQNRRCRPVPTALWLVDAAVQRARSTRRGLRGERLAEGGMVRGTRGTGAGDTSQVEIDRENGSGALCAPGCFGAAGQVFREQVL